jgi:hypothetical protein
LPTSVPLSPSVLGAATIQKAYRRLGEINAELSLVEAELRSIDAAISENINKEQVA